MHAELLTLSSFTELYIINTLSTVQHTTTTLIKNRILLTVTLRERPTQLQHAGVHQQKAQRSVHLLHRALMTLLMRTLTEECSPLLAAHLQTEVPMTAAAAAAAEAL
jgi:hypothetical protein